MVEVLKINELCNVPAIYLMQDKKDVVYIGESGELKKRINQHLIRKDSSITTGASAVCLKTEYLKNIKWFESDVFNDETQRKAAEIIAFNYFNPVIRSRGNEDRKARKLSEDTNFRNKIEEIFSNEASGCLKIQNLETTLEKIDELNKKINRLESIFERMHENDSENILDKIHKNTIEHRVENINKNYIKNRYKTPLKIRFIK